MHEHKPLKLTGTFDIEVSDWSNFVLGVTYDGHRPKVFYNGDEMIDHMRRIGGVWYGHAAGVFDILYVLERCRARGLSCQIDRSQHRVSRVVIGGAEPALTLRDSYSIWPVPLDDICGALGRPIPSLPWPCVCAKKTKDNPKGCRGYCQIGSRAAAGEPDLETYCIADCRDLYDGLLELDDFAERSRVNLRGTLAQTAWVAAQDELGVPDSEIPWELWRKIRSGDRGGRIAVIRPHARGPGSHHDICNAYPAQLSNCELPVGACAEVGGFTAQRALENARPGLYTVTVRVPEDQFLPPLPWNHGGQMNFPTGEFSGTWPLPELVAAFERGTTIVKVHTAIVFEATAAIFKPLVDRWYEIRREVGRKTPHGQWIGRLAKALTGKFAERPERSRVVMHPDTIKVCLREKRCRDGCTKRCGAYEQIDLKGEIWAVPYQRLGTSAYPQWSAYLRAQTRVQLLEQAERFGKDLALMNTDSIWSTGRLKPEPLGDGLGEWELVNTWRDLEVRSPTCYAFRHATGAKSGTLEIRGVPGLTEEDWRRGKGIIERGVVTFGAAARTTKGLFTKRARRWTLPQGERLYYGDRKLGNDGCTYPMDAAEIRELVKIRREQAR